MLTHIENISIASRVLFFIKSKNNSGKKRRNTYMCISSPEKWTSTAWKPRDRSHTYIHMHSKSNNTNKYSAPNYRRLCTLDFVNRNWVRLSGRQLWWYACMWQQILTCFAYWTLNDSDNVLCLYVNEKLTVKPHTLNGYGIHYFLCRLR